MDRWQLLLLVVLQAQAQKIRAGSMAMRDPAMEAKMKKMRSPAKGGPAGHPLARMDSGPAARAGSMRGMLPPGARGLEMMNNEQRAPNRWDWPEDDILLALSVEFGQNWPLLSEILRSVSSLRSHYRRPEFLKVQFQRLLAAKKAELVEREDPLAQNPLMLANSLMSKQTAKEIMAVGLVEPTLTCTVGLVMAAYHCVLMTQSFRHCRIWAWLLSMCQGYSLQASCGCGATIMQRTKCFWPDWQNFACAGCLQSLNSMVLQLGLHTSSASVTRIC